MLNFHTDIGRRGIPRNVLVGLITAAVLLGVVLSGALGTAKVSASPVPHADTYPGTLAGPMTSAVLPVVACSSTYGVDYGTGPGPRAVVGVRARVAIPIRLVGKLRLFSDHYRSIQPLLAPSNWKCHAEIGADGGTFLDATPRNSNVTGEQLSYTLVPGCVGCAFDEYCPFANAAVDQAAGQGTCPMAPARQSDEVVYQTPSTSEGTLFVEDPPGVSGSMTPYGIAPLSRTYVTAGYLSYSTVSQPLSEVLSCTLPTSEIDICQTSWALGFAERAVLRYGP
jgi:hypothetical protein